MRSLVTARTALVFGAATLVLFAAAPPLAVFAHALSFSNVFTGLVLGVPFAIVGTLLARRLPRNPVGWVLLASAFSGALVDAGFYALLRYRHGPRRFAARPARGLSRTGVDSVDRAAAAADRSLPRRQDAVSPLALDALGYAAWVTAWVGVLTAVQVDALFFRPIRVDGTGEALVFANGPKAGVWHTVYALSNVLLVPYVAFALAWVLDAGPAPTAAPAGTNASSSSG